MKIFLLERLSVHATILHFITTIMMKSDVSCNLPCGALLGCSFVLRALEICSIVLIYERRTHLHAGTLFPTYLWSRVEVSSILNRYLHVS